MNKNLFISTALSGILLLSSAQAAIQEFTYDGNNKFTFNNVQYDGIAALNNALIAQNFNFENDDLNLAEANQRAYLDVLKNNTNNERAEFSNAFAARSNVDSTLIQSTLDNIFDFVNTIEAFGFDVLQYVDFKDFFENDLAELQEMQSFISSLPTARNANNAVNARIAELETELAASNDAIKALVDEKTVLNALTNKTVEQTTRIEEINKAITLRPEFNEIRNSVSTQEALRLNIEQFKRAMEANENSRLSEQGRADLADFVKILDRYIVTNPTTSSDLPAIQQEDSAASGAITDALIANRDIIDARIGDFAGISAGDIMETYGIWLRGSVTQATQKAKGGTSKGYKLNSSSVTIGLDTGDESVVGIAYTFAQNDVKNKTAGQNKDDIASHTISAYGKYILTPEVFLAGQGQFGVAEVKKKRNTADATNSVATAKPKAIILGAKAEIGYNYAVMQNVTLTPSAGIAYSDVKVKGYKESGPGLNREVGKITNNRTSLVAALSTKYIADMGGDMKAIPELHAAIDYAFSTKNSDTVVTILDDIAPITTPVKKAEKARYNAGASLKVIGSSKYEFTAGYDYGFAKKFQSHTGTLKVRVNL